MILLFLFLIWKISFAKDFFLFSISGASLPFPFSVQHNVYTFSHWLSVDTRSNIETGKMEIYSKGILCTMMGWFGMDEYPSFSTRNMWKRVKNFFHSKYIVYVCTCILWNGLYVMYLKENNVKVENVYNLILFKLSSSLITIIMFFFSSILFVFLHHLRFILLDFVTPFSSSPSPASTKRNQPNPSNKKT